MSQSVSLIVPLATREVANRETITGYRRRLLEEPGVTRVEVVVAGGSIDPYGLADVTPDLVTVASPADRVGDGERVAALRAAIREATGDILLVLDPRRAYEPDAVGAVLRGLGESDADLAIGVPSPDGDRPAIRSLGRRLLGVGGLASLGTADIFSGLMAVRRRQLEGSPTSHYARGSRLVLDLLAWPCGTHRDVLVPTASGDRLGVLPLCFDDLRQLKRVLDQRFGTFSRLVQFCMVGASGMVIDLTLYALLQLVLSLAPARSLAILTALIWNFSLNRRLTFNDARGGSIVRQFATYALGNALGIAINFSLSLFLPRQFSFFDQHKLAAAVVGIVVATGISFSMSRWVVFIRHAPDHAADQNADEVNPQSGLHEPAAVS